MPHFTIIAIQHDAHQHVVKNINSWTSVTDEVARLKERGYLGGKHRYSKVLHYREYIVVETVLNSVFIHRVDVQNNEHQLIWDKDTTKQQGR